MDRLLINPRKILTFTFAIFPITDIYSTFIPSISIGKLLVVMSIILNISISKKQNLIVPTSYLYFCLYMLFIPVILAPFQSWFSFLTLSHSTINAIFYPLILIFGCSFLDLEYALDILKKTTLVASIFLIFQEIAYLFVGFRIPGLIPGLGLSNLVDSNIFMQNLMETDRSSSFFAEPAHFAQYVSLGLIISLFGFTNKKNYQDIIIAIVISLALALTRSGNSLIILFFVWSFLFFHHLFSSKNLRKIIQVFFLLILIITMLFWLYSSNQEFRDVLGRTNEINGDIEGQISGYVRIIRGYFLFHDLNLLEKIFGIGSENVENYISIHPQSSYVAVTNKIINYLNGFQEVLISGGLIGVVLYFRFNLQMFKKNFLVGKVCILMLFILSLESSSYNNSLWILYWIIVISISNEFLNKAGKQASVSQQV